MKAARIVAILFNKAKKLDSFKELTEVILRKKINVYLLKSLNFNFFFKLNLKGHSKSN